MLRLQNIFWHLVGIGFSSAHIHGIIQDAVVFKQQSFDYLVIGGGTAGLALASRLAEISSINVGVIEAGMYQPDEDLINVPEYIGHGVGNASLDWGFPTAPQPNLCGRSIYIGVGKVLGGSSALNFLEYGRGSREDYNAWASLGSTRWTWNSLLPYFTKIENVVPGEGGVFPNISAIPGSVGRGRKGPLTVGYNTNRTFSQPNVIRQFAESFVKLGSYINTNPESGRNTGVWLPSRTVDPATGARTYSTFYVNHTRENLLILTGAQATKIMFSSHRKGKLVATGVEFTTAENKYVASASREVIISAGSIKTPQLLELSGIGQSRLLKSLNVTVLQDLPGVGENLQDHLLLYQDFLLKEPAPVTWDVVRNDPAIAAAQKLQYATSHDGFYAATTPVFAFHPLQDLMNASTFKASLHALDVELASKSKSFTPLQRAQYTIQRDLLIAGKVGQVEFAMLPTGGVAGTPLPGRSYITITSFISRPFSRGSIHINTTDASAKPVVDPCYFCFTFDKNNLLFTMDIVRKISQQSPLADIIEAPSYPAADADFQTYAEQRASTVFHPSGTVAMAPQNLGGVVDQNLIVYGTHNLRVVDLSVSPLLFASHPVSTVYAIAEMAADFIKYGLQRNQ